MLTAFAVACLVRFAYIGGYPQVETICPDCRVYDRVAMNLVEGRGFVGGTTGDAEFGPPDRGAPEVGIGPVYSTFLAGIYFVAGHHYVAVRVVQAVLGALVVPLIWRVTAAAFGPAVGRTAAWLVALSPPLIAYTSVVLTENLTVFLLVLSAWLLIVAIDRRDARWFVGGGLSLGVLILLREEMVVLLPVWTIVAIWQGRRRPPRPAWSHVSAYVLTAAVCVGSWSVRNYLVFGKPILVTAHGGETLWLSARGWREWDFEDPALRNLIAGLDYVKRNEVMQRDGLRMIRDAPVRYALLCLKRVPDLWISSQTSYVRGLSPTYVDLFERGAYARLGAKVLLLLLNLALLAAALAGMVTAFRTMSANAAVVWLMAAPPAIITLVHFFLFSTARYQIPALPFMLGFAAVSLTPRLQA
jgi:4-amino-4-deoxy-L-arabinose transferase-like glycosyltransferase